MLIIQDATGQERVQGLGYCHSEPFPLSNRKYCEPMTQKTAKHVAAAIFVIAIMIVFATAAFLIW